MRRILLLYMPVIHRGYLEFLAKHGSTGTECLLLGTVALRELGDAADYVLRKDKAIRAIPETFARNVIRSLGLFGRVDLHDGHRNTVPCHIVIPDEDVVQAAAYHFFPRANVQVEKVRLRYDRRSATRVDPVPATEVTEDELHRTLMGAATEAASRSKDWWLSVGAVIARDGRALFVAYNRAALDPDLPNIMGDPRSAYQRGENTEETLVEHAERDLVAQAAYHGTSLIGADAYVTHFPCVPCAASLATAGVRRIFFSQGYSRLEATELLTARGVEVIRVV